MRFRYTTIVHDLFTIYHSAVNSLKQDMDSYGYYLFEDIPKILDVITFL